MAHSPETKAQVLHAVTVEGMSYSKVKQTFGVGKATVTRWLEELRENGTERNETEQSRSQAEPATTEIARQTVPLSIAARQARFTERFFTLAEKSFDMLEAWADKCKDEAFIESNPEGCHKLGTTVIERGDRLVALLVRDKRRGETEGSEGASETDPEPG